MVQIAIQLPDGSSSCPEWSLIELQGDLETRTQDASLAGKFIGDLHFNKKGHPILIIGHHIFQGKIVNMEKPFVLLSKEVHDPMELDSSSDSKESSVSRTTYIVKAVIKKKLLFNTRPKPIIAHVPKKL